MIKKLRHVIYFGAGVAISGGESLLVISLLTRALSDNDFASIGRFLVYVPVFATVLILAVNSYVSIKYHKDKEGGFYKELGAIIVSYFFLSWVAAILVVLLFLNVFDAYAIYGLAFCVGAALVPNLIFQAYYQTSLLSKKYFGIRSCVAIIDVFIVILILQTEIAGFSKIISWYCALQVSTMIFMWVERKRIPYQIEFETLKKCFKYSLPLAPHLAVGTIGPNVDRMVSDVAMSDAGFAAYFTMFIYMGSALIVVEPINKFMAPYFFKLLSDKNHSRVKRVIVLYNFGLVLFAFVAYWLLAALYPVYTGGNYLEALSVLPILLVGVVFQGFYYGYVNILFFQERLSIISRATLISFLFVSSISYPVISMYGMYGAAFCYLAYNFMMCLQAYVNSSKEI